MMFSHILTADKYFISYRTIKLVKNYKFAVIKRILTVTTVKAVFFFSCCQKFLK